MPGWRVRSMVLMCQASVRPSARRLRCARRRRAPRRRRRRRRPGCSWPISTVGVQVARERRVLDDRDVVLVGQLADAQGEQVGALREHAGRAVGGAVGEGDRVVGRVGDDDVGVLDVAEHARRGPAARCFWRMLRLHLGREVLLLGLLLDLLLAHLQRLLEECRDQKTSATAITRSVPSTRQTSETARRADDAQRLASAADLAELHELGTCG